jgi:hypothetical protein
VCGSKLTEVGSSTVVLVSLIITPVYVITDYINLFLFKNIIKLKKKKKNQLKFHSKCQLNWLISLRNISCYSHIVLQRI